MKLETIKIKDSGKRGFKIINKSDFDGSKDKMFAEQKTKKTKTRTETE